MWINHYSHWVRLLISSWSFLLLIFLELVNVRTTSVEIIQQSAMKYAQLFLLCTLNYRMEFYMWKSHNQPLILKFCFNSFIIVHFQEFRIFIRLSFAFHTLKPTMKAAFRLFRNSPISENNISKCFVQLLFKSNISSLPLVHQQSCCNSLIMIKISQQNWSLIYQEEDV